LHNQNTVQLNKQKVFQSFDSSRKSALATGSASGYITPSLLNSYYDIFTNDGHNLATQSIFSSSNQYFSPANIASFQQAYNIPAHPVDADPNHRSSSFQCISNPSKCQESNLDLEYILALAQNTYTSLVYVCVGVLRTPDGLLYSHRLIILLLFRYYDSTADALLAWIIAVASMTNPPLVHSLSYSWTESEIAQSPSLYNSFNTQAIKLGQWLM